MSNRKKILSQFMLYFSVNR